MFMSGMKESEAKEVIIEDVRMPAFRSLLNFLYTGEIEFGTDGARLPAVRDRALTIPSSQDRKSSS